MRDTYARECDYAHALVLKFVNYLVEMKRKLDGGENLEQCKVCGDPSSGWYYGAITCEACKKFFSRNFDETKFKCVRNNDCLIEHATRVQCQYCRLKKCKEIGMKSDYGKCMCVFF